MKGSRSQNVHAQATLTKYTLSRLRLFCMGVSGTRSPSFRADPRRTRPSSTQGSRRRTAPAASPARSERLHRSSRSIAPPPPPAASLTASGTSRARLRPAATTRPPPTFSGAPGRRPPGPGPCGGGEGRKERGRCGHARPPPRRHVVALPSGRLVMLRERGPAVLLRPVGGFLGFRGAPAPDRQLRGGQGCGQPVVGPGLIPPRFPHKALRAVWQR